MSIVDPADQVPEMAAPGPSAPEGLDVEAPAETAARETHGPGRLAHAGLLATGLMIAGIGAAAAAARTIIRGVTVPWGLVLVLVTLGICARAGAWLLGTRRGAVLVAVGWLFLTLVFATVNPGGDVLLPDVTRTYVYLVGGVLVVLVAALWPLPRGARELVQGPAPARDADPAQDLDPAPAPLD